VKKPSYRDSALVESQLGAVPQTLLWPGEHRPQGKSEQTLLAWSVKEHRRRRDGRISLQTSETQPHSPEATGQEQKCQKLRKRS